MSEQEHITAMLLEIERLRLRITALEAGQALAIGTLAQPARDGTRDARIIHNVKPSAPPHNEE